MNRARADEIDLILHGNIGIFVLFQEKVGEVLEQQRNDKISESNFIVKNRAWVEVFRELEDFANFMRKDHEAQISIEGAIG